MSSTERSIPRIHHIIFFAQEIFSEKFLRHAQITRGKNQDNHAEKTVVIFFDTYKKQQKLALVTRKKNRYP